MKKLEIIDQRVTEAIVLYKTGKSLSEVCKISHMDKEAFRKVLLELNILRTRSEAVRTGKLSGNLFDDTIFDILTPEVLYWIGFLYADGHIEKEPRCRVTFTLGEKDRSHVEKFNQFLGGCFEVKEIKRSGIAPGQINFDYKYFRLGFSSKKVYNRLVELGFTHNKTLSLQPHELLKNSREFWRGVIDGDGWICKSTDKRAKDTWNQCYIIGLSGTEETTYEFGEFLRRSGIITKAQPRKDSRARCWKIEIHSKETIKVANLLYKDSKIYLERKYQEYLELIKDENNSQLICTEQIN